MLKIQFVWQILILSLDTMQKVIIIIINGFYWGQKRFTTTYNGPLTYNNAVKDVIRCITIHKQNKLIYEINKSTKIDLYAIIIYT
jgi:hypothetical protein